MYGRSDSLRLGSGPDNRATLPKLTMDFKRLRKLNRCAFVPPRPTNPLPSYESRTHETIDDDNLRWSNCSGWTDKARKTCIHKTRTNPPTACIQGLQQTLHSVVHGEKMSVITTVAHSQRLNEGPQLHVSEVAKAFRERDTKRRSASSGCVHHATESSNLQDVHRYIKFRSCCPRPPAYALKKPQQRLQLTDF